MILRHSLLALTGVLALAGTSHAGPANDASDTYLVITATNSAPAVPVAKDGWCPLDARVIALGAASAVVYYTYDEGGADVVRVVTTIGTDEAPPARFVSYLTPGQKSEVSVAGAVDTPQAALEFVYSGHDVTVRPVAAPPES